MKNSKDTKDLPMYSEKLQQANRYCRYSSLGKTGVDLLKKYFVLPSTR